MRGARARARRSAVASCAQFRSSAGAYGAAFSVPITPTTVPGFAALTLEFQSAIGHTALVEWTAEVVAGPAVSITASPTLRYVVQAMQCITAGSC
jgi:hypothetical protein